MVGASAFSVRAPAKSICPPPVLSMLAHCAAKLGAYTCGAASIWPTLLWARLYRPCWVYPFEHAAPVSPNPSGHPSAEPLKISVFFVAALR